MNDPSPSPGGDHDDGAARAPGSDAAHLSPVARLVGSDEAMVWVKRGSLALALAFLVWAFGYMVGVRTTAVARNSVDVGFLADMTDHHDQAVRLSMIELANGSDPVTKGFAMEVIMAQRQELGRMTNFQDDYGVVNPDYDPKRTTMAWMGMPTPLDAMTGMATEEQIAAFGEAKGIDADRLFLTLMQSHHLGGAHMAEYAADNGADPRVKDMAGRMARNQRIEVNEYQGVLDRLRGT